MQPIPFSVEDYAERFGVICRGVLRDEPWDACRASLRRSWDALAGVRKSWKAPEMSWEQAVPHIHKAWES